MKIGRGRDLVEGGAAFMDELLDVRNEMGRFREFWEDVKGMNHVWVLHQIGFFAGVFKPLVIPDLAVLEGVEAGDDHHCRRKIKVRYVGGIGAADVDDRVIEVHGGARRHESFPHPFGFAH